MTTQNTAVSQLTPAGYACLDTIQEIVTKLGGSREVCLAIASLGNSHPDEGVLEELRHRSALLDNIKNKAVGATPADETNTGTGGSI